MKTSVKRDEWETEKWWPKSKVTKPSAAENQKIRAEAGRSPPTTCMAAPQCWPEGFPVPRALLLMVEFWNPVKQQQKNKASHSFSGWSSFTFQPRVFLACSTKAVVLGAGRQCSPDQAGTAEATPSFLWAHLVVEGSSVCGVSGFATDNTAALAFGFHPRIWSVHRTFAFQNLPSERTVSQLSQNRTIWITVWFVCL